MTKPTDQEQKLRDAAAIDYCVRLAQKIKYRFNSLEGAEKAAFDESWKHAFQFDQLDGIEAKNIANIAQLLYEQPRAQARLATICDYPPAKWLLEQELTARNQWPPVGVDINSVDVYDHAASLRLSGICFSGGGIRSATFNLGVLQGLAASDRLNSFDYLSSVSGGGYIHQFLASWISCENIEKVKQQLQPLPGPPSKRNFWPEPLRWLRRYSNYLTPQVGLFTADTWVAFAIWARNTFLNQIVLTAALLIILLLPNFHLTPQEGIAPYLLRNGLITAIIIVACFAWATYVIWGRQIRRPPTDHCHPFEETGWGQKGILLSVFLPILIAVLAFCPYLYRSSFWAGNLLPHAGRVMQRGPRNPFEEKIQRVVNTVAWPSDGSIVAPSTRVHISHLHRLAPTPVPAPQITASCVDNGGTSALACTALVTNGTNSSNGTAGRREAAAIVSSAQQVLDSGKRRLPPIGEPAALDNIRAWQTTYSFRWWKPLSEFSADWSTSLVFTSMLLGIALLAGFTWRAITPGIGRLITLLAVFGVVGAGYVLINLSRLVIFMASFLLPLEHVTRTAIPLLPWLGLTVVFVSVEIGGGVVGNLVDESVREWFARLRAWSFLFGISWLALTGCSLLGPGIVRWLIHARFGASVWGGWILTTLGSVLIGKSSVISGTAKDQGSKTALILNAFSLVGPPVFIAGLLLSLSWVVEKALLSIESQLGQSIIPHTAFLVLLLLLAATMLLFGWRIDVNEFSLHSFYRDRIARCYAGASNPDRRANRFTGFAPSDKHLRLIDLLPRSFDNPELKHLWANTCGPTFCSTEPQRPMYEGPFPIFNTTLNLSFGQDLAYQERKGASFVFTPLYCGYDVGWTETDTPRIQFNGFTPTRSFAYNDGGPRMSTAVATSGAAMSPNWGFHSSPPMAFLLTIFNVRLGLWIRNPRHKQFRLTGLRSNSNPPSPWFGLFYLLAELFGMVNDSAAFVYLTDGGHFENMGLYELVRRHCSTIVICDSEQDGNLIYQGIGMAIRKCRIDHGAEIDLDLSKLEPAGDPAVSPCCAVPGKIHYANGATGEVLYIKSVYTAGLPGDLVNYRKENPTFPNTSTLDQWFSESQFESYRRLGQEHARSGEVLAWMAQHLPIRPSSPPPAPPTATSGAPEPSVPGAPLPGGVPAPSSPGQSS
ncbi:MAG: hypothetical protein PW789_05765 [Edaphobacter sp.]|uniref:hypothetical protein n=1 Tax=Edaphobacter sp. TaxID=1934404 RepID=UPI0023A22051|nr:hypothetical protein [Edaphobacter sp.]MDE1176098.1 hypothetical protein [Edaphobacter sp.]